MSLELKLYRALRKTAIRRLSRYVGGCTLCQRRWRNGEAHRPWCIASDNYGRMLAVIVHVPIEIKNERKRQISVERFHRAHDAMHENGELLLAAQCYYDAATLGDNWRALPEAWPWEADMWKPSEPRRELEKAGALALAELDRLMHSGLSGEPAARALELLKKIVKEYRGLS